MERSWQHPSVFFLLIVWTLNGVTANDPSAPCDVSVSCNCCLTGKCRTDTGYCEGGCKNGYWGGFCKRHCPPECVSCKDNFGTDNLCYECVPGHYGRDCSSSCSTGCKVCNKDSGECEECRDGYYDLDCSKRCSEGCKDGLCDKISGKCFKCDVGYFGAETCSMQCSQTCNNLTCDIKTGDCLGCIANFYGSFCNIACPFNCYQNICIQATGHCFDCKGGYFGQSCNQSCSDNCKRNICYKDGGDCIECENGYYGNTCTETCSGTCKDKLCDQYTGNCSNGCIEGFMGDRCDVCVRGKYGDDCEQNCSLNCLNSECNRTDGLCTSGCEPGYFDSNFCCSNNNNCSTCANYTECSSCINGTYGAFCDQTCPVNCAGACDKVTGNCFQCELDYYGLKCHSTCSEQCLPTDVESTRCHSSDGRCTAGCDDKHFGAKCNNECSAACDGTCDRQSGRCHSCKGNTFGSVCEQNCPNGCLPKNDVEASCSRENGSCTFGCQPRLYGTMCDSKCSSYCNGSCDRATGQCFQCTLNRFGLYCEHTCSDGCVKGLDGTHVCNETTGTCYLGCEDGFSGEMCSNEKASDADKGFPTAIVAAAAGGAVLVIAVVIIVVVLIRRFTRKREGKQSPLKEHSSSSDANKSLHAYQNTEFNAAGVDEEELEEGAPVTVTIQRDEEANPYYSNARRPVTKIRKKNLRQFLYKSDENYKEEFQFLPDGLMKPTTEAKKSGNASKNRYRMVYPYDDSRVKIKDTGSDYINACYIDGFRKNGAYIASQGPTIKQLGKDFKTFWQMVWQEKVETIVMVTKLHEVTGMKCDKYWPDLDSSSNYAGFSVKCVKQEEFAEFTVRSLNISKGKEERYLNHVYFTAWPDKGVPNDVISLINLRHKVVKMRKMFDGPLLVHCSAGIGRTGTYIALDILTRQGSTEDHVDVFDCVVNMRNQRVNMVQTLEQYKFLHHAVLWTLTSDIEPLPADCFMDLSWLSDHKLNEMFEQLQLKNFYDTAEEQRAMNENQSIPFSNRHGADIPGHKHTVPLVENARSGMSRYINAVYLDSYKKQNRFIAAMTPLPDTVTQFLSMIIQENVTCIVDLTPFDCDHDDIGEYLPVENQDVEWENQVFRISHREDHSCYVKREITVTGSKKSAVKGRRIMHHYCFTKWNASDTLPGSTDDFVTLVNEVDATVNSAGSSGPIVVHCLSGAERSGLFCAVWLLIERMTIDREVSVLNTLRQVKTRRRTAIPSSGQIAFSFECVASHLKYLDQRVYSNTAIKVHV